MTEEEIPIKDWSDDALDEEIFECRQNIVCHFVDNPQFLTEDLRKYMKELDAERGKRLDEEYKKKQES